MISLAYVFIDLLEEKDPVLVGLVAMDRSTGRFVYGNHYLQRDDAIALDPIKFQLLHLSSELSDLLLLWCQLAVTSESLSVAIFLVFLYPAPSCTGLISKLLAASARVYPCSKTKLMASSLNSFEYCFLLVTCFSPVKVIVT